MPAPKEHDLDDHLRVNSEIWRAWKERGVSEHTPLAVDFRFYSAHEVNAQELARVLREAGFQVAVESTRTAIVFRGFEVVATHSQCWTLGMLNDRTREFITVAEKLQVGYEGFGAEMPDN